MSETISYCKLHGTHPADNEPCWQCINQFNDDTLKAKADCCEELVAALKRLCKKYIQNRGTTVEFISCITPEGIPDYWLQAEAALAKYKEIVK